MPIELPFDLLHLIKECQLQHGLRTNDFDRYHKYLTNRLATVRKQLNFKAQEGTGRKGQITKYQSKEITPQVLLSTISSTNANSASGSAASASEALVAFSLSATSTSKASNAGGGRYLELLALYTERCWATYEAAVQKKGKKEGGEIAGSSKSKTAAANSGDSSTNGLVDARKKLTKATKWAEQLFEVASKVYSPNDSQGKNKYAESAASCIVYTCEGYFYETRGRNLIAHNSPASVSSAEFAKARDCYYKAIEAINEMIRTAPESALTQNTTASGDGHANATKMGIEQTYQLLAAKIAELDDRVLFAQQQQQKEGSAAAYKPTVIPPLVQRVGGATTTTKSASGAEGTTQSSFLTARSTVEWMVPATGSKGKTVDPADNEIPVFNIKVKENLREAAAVGAPEAMRAVLNAVNAEGNANASSSTAQKSIATNVTTSDIIHVGQQLRVVDLFDRSIGFLNDALTHARSELRNVQGDLRRRQVQRLVLFLQYHINRQTAERTLFAVECLARRFWFHVQQKRNTSTSADGTNTSSAQGPAAPKNKKGIKAHKVPSASPTELVRLYTTAQDTLTDAYHTPGIEGSDSAVAIELEEQIELCKAGRLLYTGEAWNIVGNAPSALQSLQAAKKQLEAVMKTNSSKSKNTDLSVALSADFMFQKATISILLVGVELNLTSYRAAQANEKEQKQAEAAGSTRYLIDHLDEGTSFVVTEEKKSYSPKTDSNKELEAKKSIPPQRVTTANLVKLPPSYIPIGSKPAFVDIAATFIDFGDFESAKKSQAKAASTTAKPSSQVASNTAPRAHAKVEPKADNDAPQKEKKGWLGGWGWGGSKQK